MFQGVYSQGSFLFCIWWKRNEDEEGLNEYEEQSKEPTSNVLADGCKGEREKLYFHLNATNVANLCVLSLWEGTEGLQRGKSCHCLC